MCYRALPRVCALAPGAIPQPRRRAQPAGARSPPAHAPLAPRPPLCAAAWEAWASQHAARVHARAQCGRAAAFWRLSRLIAATNAWQRACQ